MAVFFEAVPKRDPQTGEQKWYPQLKMIGAPIQTPELSIRIANESALSPGDVESVMRNFPHIINELLKESHSVKINGFGTFILVAKSKYGVDRPEDVCADQIHLVVHFIPEKKRDNHGTYADVFTSGITFKRWEGSSHSSAVASQFHALEVAQHAASSELDAANHQLEEAKADGAPADALTYLSGVVAKKKAAFEAANQALVKLFNKLEAEESDDESEDENA